MIDNDRLGKTFEQLVRIDSVSREEGAICRELVDIFEGLGGTTAIDGAGEKTGSDTGNLVVKFPGTLDVEPIFLSGHMDTVEPGRGVKPQFKDGVYTSDGTTILGSDDKSALAIIIEVIRVIRERNLPHGPLELVITVCEEVGLLGAKHLDFSLMESKMGYILDSTDVEGIVTRAPYANQLDITVKGKSAHAGACPENGVSAISIAAHAISRLTLGRLDEVTTCNLGTIEGGTATNIVPDTVRVMGEVRSHDKARLDSVTEGILDAFREAAEAFRTEAFTPELELGVELDFCGTNIPEDHRVVTLAREAAANLGRSMESKTIGGGADANVFFGKGVMAGVIGTGMTDVHTLKESVKLSDMVACAELLMEIIRIHGEGAAA